MQPFEFIEKWRASQLKESSGAQEHFIDLCRLLGEPTPAEDDPTGERYCFERGARKDSGGDGWADVWRRNCFAWEYKGKHKDLGRAFDQLRQYALALDNPPLLIVSDMESIRITTNWTNSISVTETLMLDDLADAGKRRKLKWAMSKPERLRPNQSRQDLTERVAETFASLAQALRDRGHHSHRVAKFVNRLVFCMFAEDVDLLPNDLFTRMLETTRQKPSLFVPMTGSSSPPWRLATGSSVLIQCRTSTAGYSTTMTPCHWRRPRSRPSCTPHGSTGPTSTRRSSAPSSSEGSIRTSAPNSAPTTPTGRRSC